MPTIPIVHLTDTTLQVVDFDRLLTETPAYEALMAWLRDHGIDPNTVPAESVVEIFRESRTIQHGYRVKGVHGTQSYVTVCDHSIAPWPAEVVALAKTYGGRDDELEDLRRQVAERDATIANLRADIREAFATKETR